MARAFSNNPAILLADEPTGNLDSHNGSHIFELMSELHQKNKTTLILVTHEADLAAKAQRVIRLRDGEIEADEMN